MYDISFLLQLYQYTQTSSDENGTPCQHSCLCHEQTFLYLMFRNHSWPLARILCFVIHTAMIFEVHYIVLGRNAGINPFIKHAARWENGEFLLILFEHFFVVCIDPLDLVNITY